jgi:DNA-binding response OmpR family regulator
MKLARTGIFALVILDLILPDVSGISLLDTLKALLPDQEVIILTALADPNAKVHCLEHGASDYVTTPFDPAELVARVRLRLRERARIDEKRHIRRGNYTLDLQKRVFHIGDVPMLLATREADLLAYLMTRAGEACSREEIRNQIWGGSPNLETNVVDVCVSRLRQKLGDDDCLQTVRNVGYLFVD